MNETANWFHQRKFAIGRLMSSILDDPHHWRMRAKEARAIADETDNEMVRRSMLRIADEYEAVARKAAGRVRSGP